MYKLFSLNTTRVEDSVVTCTGGFSGMSGKAIAIFVGGMFLAALIIFFLIANWDYIGNGILCFAQGVAGMNTHYHFPMRDGSVYPNCTANASGGQGTAGDGNQ